MKTGEIELNYFALLISGVIFIVLGLILDNPDTIKPVFILMGILFLIVSFVNKNKWKKTVFFEEILCC